MIDPQLVGAHWAAPAVGDLGGGTVDVVIAILVDDPTELGGDDIGATAWTASGALTPRVQPAPGLLGKVTLVSTNVVAYFEFDNPADEPVTTVEVVILGEAASFAMDAIA